MFASPCKDLVTSTTIEENEVSVSQNESLKSELTFEEFKVAIKQMLPDKTSGPDGLNPDFFQHFWGLLGREIFSCCKA